MKKTFKLEELGCANCARKMEDAIKKLDGVLSADISFMTQKLTLSAQDGQFDDIVQAAAKIVEKIEPDCRLMG